MRNKISAKQVEEFTKRKLEDFTKSGTWELDLISDKFLLSEGLVALLSLVPTSIPTRFSDFTEYITESDRVRLVELIQRVKTTGEEGELIFEIATLDHTTLIVKSKIHVLFNDKQDPIRLIGAIQPLSTCNTVYSNLRAEKELTNQLIEHLPNSFFIINREQRLIFTNKRFRDLLFQPDDDLNSFKVLDIFDEDEQKIVLQKLHTAFETGSASMESSLKLNNGLNMPVYLTANKINYQGEDCIFGIGVDLSETKKILFELRTMLDNSDELFILLDSSLVVTSFNHKFNSTYIDLFGKTPEIGKSIMDYHLLSDKETIKNLLNAVLKGEIISKESHSTKNTIFKVNFKPIYSEFQEIVGVYINAQDITAEKLALKHLQYREHYLSNILKSSIDLICTFDNEGRFLVVSPSCFKILGYTPEELVGKPYIDFIIDQEKSKTLEADKKLKSNGVNTNFINHYQHKNGTIIPLIWSASWDEQDQIMYCTARDGTEQLSAEEKIRLSERRFKSLVENASDIVSIIDIEGNYTFVSTSTKSILGYDPDLFLGKNAFDFIHPDDIDAVRSSFQQVFSQRHVKLKPFRFIHKNGSWRWIETIITNLIDDPAVNGIVTNTTDITEKIESAMMIEQSEYLFKSLVQEGADLTAILDPDGKYRYISSNYKTILGYEPDELVGDNAFNFIHPEDHDSILAQFEQLLSSDRIKSDPYRYKRKDGSYCWIQWTGTNKIYDEIVSGLVINSIDVTDLVLSQRSLKEINERYDYVYKASQDAIYDWDIENDLFEWSEQFKATYNHSSPYRLNNWIENTHPFDNRLHEDRWLEFMKNKNETRWSNEFRFKKADGNYAIVSEIGYLIRSEKGKPIRMIGAIRDISEEKLNEYKQKLQQKISVIFKHEDSFIKAIQETLSFLIEISGFEIAELWLKSTDNKHLNLISYYNGSDIAKHFYELCHQINRIPIREGLPGEILNMDTSFVWENIEQHDKFLRKVAAEKTKMKSFFGIPVKHNETKIGALIFGSSQDNYSSNQVTGELISLIDFFGNELTRKMKEEEAHLLFHSAPEIISIVSPNGYFTKVNPAFCELMEYTEEELTTLPIEQFINPNDLDQFLSELSKSLEKKQISNKNINNRFYTKSGNSLWISWSFSANFGEDRLVFAFGRDISNIIASENSLLELNEKLKQHSKELEISNAELEKFAYVASHDLQEPLRMVSSFMALLEKKYASQLDDKAKQYIHFAVDGSQRMKQIIHDLLQYSRVGRIEENIEKFSIEEIISDYLHLRKRAIEEKNVQIKYANLPHYLGFKAPITQVFHNLLDNAIKYSKNGVPPEIEITCTLKDQFYEFCVSDNGIGIHPDYFDRIFVIFQRLHNKEDYSGTGMGLTIVRKIIENFGGTIQVRSRENVGSQFIFTLPKEVNYIATETKLFD